MSADRTADWTPGERLHAIVAQEINDAPAAELIQAAVDDVLRGWAARIRETGTAKGWSVWAADFINPDVEFVGTGMPSTETIVAELRRLDRAAVLREAADFYDQLLKDMGDDVTCDSRYWTAIRDVARGLRRRADDIEQEKDTSGGHQLSAGESTPAEPLIVSRYDDAMEPAPEEEPVFVVGAVAQDGRPVALLFDREARAKVGGWLAPDATARATAQPNEPDEASQ